jgi:hypothetical protein
MTENKAVLVIGLEPTQHESELAGSAELIATRLRSYQSAGLQYLVLDPTHHDEPAQALKAIEFFAFEVRPLLG